MLQFQSSSEKLFFWLQEKSTDRDTIILEQLNTLIQTQEDEDEEEFLDSEDVAMEGVEESGKLDKYPNVIQSHLTVRNNKT